MFPFFFRYSLIHFIYKPYLLASQVQSWAAKHHIQTLQPRQCMQDLFVFDQRRRIREWLGPQHVQRERFFE